MEKKFTKENAEKTTTWVNGWEKGFKDGHEHAIEEIQFILKKGDLPNIYEKLWRDN